MFSPLLKRPSFDWAFLHNRHHNLWYDEIKANGSLKYKD